MKSGMGLAFMVGVGFGLVTHGPTRSSRPRVLLGSLGITKVARKSQEETCRSPAITSR